MKITLPILRNTLLTAIASLTMGTPVHATPLRELIFQAIDQEHHGVLTEQEIKAARLLGAVWDHQHIQGVKFERAEKLSAEQTFPGDAIKQREWILEIGIGWMMAEEASLWEPS